MYQNLRLLPDGRLACTAAFIFTTAILVGLDEYGYDDRWCYEREEDAVAALAAWNPPADPEPAGWIRHPNTGRRRPKGNAAKEYVNR